MSLLFCTTNHHKFELAKRAFAKNNLKIEQIRFEVDEVQSKDPDIILKTRTLWDDFINWYTQK